jgi:hypothetical protein
MRVFIDIPLPGSETDFRLHDLVSLHDHRLHDLVKLLCLV